MLAARCRSLTGVDPSDNIDENTLLHHRAKCMLQDYVTDRRYDLITMRMVAEHITDPAVAVAALRRLLKPDGQVVIYTVYKFAPVSLIASWDADVGAPCGEGRGVGGRGEGYFPDGVQDEYAGRAGAVVAAEGMQEMRFRRLDGHQVHQPWLLLNATELLMWRVFNLFGVPYPEHCLLGVYAPSTGNAHGP